MTSTKNPPRDRREKDDLPIKLTYREMSNHLAVSVHTTNLLVAENSLLRRELDQSSHMFNVAKDYLEELGGTPEDFLERYEGYMAKLYPPPTGTSNPEPDGPDSSILGV